MEYEIRFVSEEEYPACVEVIREAFSTVAGEFNLTRENAPTNPAFIELRHMLGMRDKGIRMYGLFEENVAAGFVALDRISESAYEMKRLAVSPKYRHKGFGEALVRFIEETVRNEGGTLIQIGIINENTVLKNWYQSLGFRETETKAYEHLPFTVCSMELGV